MTELGRLTVSFGDGGGDDDAALIKAQEETNKNRAKNKAELGRLVVSFNDKGGDDIAALIAAAKKSGENQAKSKEEYDKVVGMVDKLFQMVEKEGNSIEIAGIAKLVWSAPFGPEINHQDEKTLEIRNRLIKLDQELILMQQGRSKKRSVTGEEERKAATREIKLLNEILGLREKIGRSGGEQKNG